MLQLVYTKKKIARIRKKVKLLQTFPRSKIKIKVRHVQATWEIN